jgi:hypothetical protein
LSALAKKPGVALEIKKANGMRTRVRMMVAQVCKFDPRYGS